MVFWEVVGGIGDKFFNWGGVSDYFRRNGIQFRLLWDQKRNNCSPFEAYFRLAEPEKWPILNCQLSDYPTFLDGRYLDCSMRLHHQVGGRTYEGYSKSNPIKTMLESGIFSNDYNVLVHYRTKGMDIANGMHIYGHRLDIPSGLQPSEGVQRQVELFQSQFGWTQDNPPVGMHVRRTDYRSIIRDYPDEVFFDRVDQILQQEPKSRVFLCTDSPEVKDGMVKRFGQDRILTRRTHSRYEEGGMWDSVVDLFLMSRCRVLWGTPSGFVHLAAQIGKVPLFDVKSGKEVQP